MTQTIKCVIFDWAGTAIDYGCFAPVAAFVESFRQIGCAVTEEETRRFMGKTKIEETRALFALPHVSEEYAAKHGHAPGEADVAACYEIFRETLLTSLEAYSVPVPGMIEAAAELRKREIEIGSTTGYTAEMMRVVQPAAERHGYHVDLCVTAEGMPGGRPKPYMIYKNLTELDVADRREAVKVGDTIADIREGVNAGVWSVGVILGSNELALTLDEAEALPAEELSRRMERVRLRMYAAGADYVIGSIRELPALIDSINGRMAFQDR